MRVVVGLHEGADVDAAAAALRSLGASAVHGPQPSLPGVLVADVPGDDPPAVVAAIAALPAVRYAEPDALRSTGDGPSPAG